MRQPEGAKSKPVSVKMSIGRITKALCGCVTAAGYDVYVSDSRTTNSRYLYVILGKRKRITIRISDHYTKKWWKYNFDVYTDRPRARAKNYRECIGMLRRRMEWERSRNRKYSKS